MKGKAYATTPSDLDSSNLDLEDSCDEEENFSAFMTIAYVESSEDLNLLVQELGEHSNEESMGIVEESDVEVNEDTADLRENYTLSLHDALPISRNHLLRVQWTQTCQERMS